MKALIALAGLLIALGAVGSSPSRDSTFRQDEVECEEAVAHLVECCPTLHAQQFFCDHIAAFGCSPGRYPDFAESQSRAIREQSCAEMHEADTCSWAAAVAAQPDTPPPSEGL